MIERCPLCGSTQSREVFRAFRPKEQHATGRHTEDLFGRAGKLIRCTSCDLVRQEDPIEAPYEEAEDPEYLSEEPGIRATFRDVLERIERHRRPPGRLLDVGSGPGLLLDEATKRGWDATGIEPSAWGAAQARARNLRVINGVLGSDELEPAAFDAITAADVIEHVDDPVGFAQRISELLAPGGVVFIATPDVGSLVARVLRRWWWSVIPNHLLLFSRATLDRALQGAGLRVIETTTHPKTFSVDYYAGRFGGYSGALGRASRAIGRLFGGTSKLVTPDFRDRIAMIATKT